MYAGQKKMKKVFFLIPTLGGGGAERVMFYLLKSVDRSKFIPSLILFERDGELLLQLPSDINIMVLKSDKNILWRIWGFTWFILASRFSLLAKTEKPDVVVSFMWYANLIALMARLFSRIDYRVIVSERYGLTVSYEGKLIEFLRRIIIHFIYPRSDSIIVNSKEMGRQLIQKFGIPQNKVAIIYNPIDICRVTEFSKEKVDRLWHKEKIPIIIGIGRLTPQKGFSYLIKTIHKVSEEGVPCSLIILGQGKEERELKNLVIELEMESKIFFLGFQQNPYKYLAHSSIFILSSLYEGFPNVLLEALALGKPCIATRCPTGPDEIITDEVDGLLIPPADEDALAVAIKRLLVDEELRKKLGEAGRRRAEDFKVDKIVKQYEDVIQRVCAGSAAK